jgi:hypothetical protein
MLKRAKGLSAMSQVEFHGLPFPFQPGVPPEAPARRIFRRLLFEAAAQRMDVFAHLFWRQFFLPSCHERECAPEIYRRQSAV